MLVRERARLDLRADDTDDAAEDEDDPEDVTLQKRLTQKDRGGDTVEDDGEAAERCDQGRRRVSERRKIQLRGEPIAEEHFMGAGIIYECRARKINEAQCAPARRGH